MNPLHPPIAARAEYRCEYCRAPEAAFNLAFEVEHIVPVAREGEDAEQNLALSCRACNAHKSTRTNGKDPKMEWSFRCFIHARMFGNNTLPLMPRQHQLPD